MQRLQTTPRSPLARAAWSMRMVLGVLAAAVVAGTVALRPRMRHVVVAGTSMYPTLHPGDRLITISTRRAPRVGGLALAPDPREPQRVLIKRVHGIAAGLVDLRGDAAQASTDSRTFGAVQLRTVEGCAAVRYHPVGRAGYISPSRGPGDQRRCHPRGRR